MYPFFLHKAPLRLTARETPTSNRIRWKKCICKTDSYWINQCFAILKLTLSGTSGQTLCTKLIKSKFSQSLNSNKKASCSLKGGQRKFYFDMECCGNLITIKFIN